MLSVRPGIGCRPDDSGLVGVDDDLDAVAQLEFHQDPADVAADGGVFDHKIGGDLPVGQALRDFRRTSFSRGVRTVARRDIA